MEEKKVMYADDLKFDFIVENVVITAPCKFYNGYITKGDITEVYIINIKTDIIINHFIISTTDINKVKNAGVYRLDTSRTHKIKLCGKPNNCCQLSRIILDVNDNTYNAYRKNARILDYTRDNLIMNKKKDIRLPAMAKKLCCYENTFDHHGNKLPSNIIYDHVRKQYMSSYKTPEENAIYYKRFTEKQYKTLDKALERVNEFVKLGFVISNEEIILFNFDIKTNQGCIYYDIHRGNSRMFYINSNNSNLLDIHVNTKSMRKYIIHANVKYIEYLKTNHITILQNHACCYATTYIEGVPVKQPLQQYGLKTEVIKINKNEFDLVITSL